MFFCETTVAETDSQTRAFNVPPARSIPDVSRNSKAVRGRTALPKRCSQNRRTIVRTRFAARQKGA